MTKVRNAYLTLHFKNQESKVDIQSMTSRFISYSWLDRAIQLLRPITYSFWIWIEREC